MPHKRVVIVGAGMAGLAAALDLAAAGLEVTVLERAACAGGKLREIDVAGRPIDAGPTVLTMRGVFDELFASAGEKLEAHLSLSAASVLARHAWSAEETLDLFADSQLTLDAIGRFAGAAEARRYTAFIAEAARVHRALEQAFMRASRPSVLELIRRAGPRGLGELARIRPFDTLWEALGGYFHDPRLRQLFGRYATYCGSSPFAAPATLMLIAHVEQQGVWLVEGGMQRIAAAIARLASARGVRFLYQTHAQEISTRHGQVAEVRTSEGERLAADAVLVNADTQAVATGLLGAAVSKAVEAIAPTSRSLSALTWALVAEAEGFPLARHTVFFSSDYPAEFRQLLDERCLPSAPTVYVCAQDRQAAGPARASGPERLLCLVNAPAFGDSGRPHPQEIETCERATFRHLEHCGLKLRRSADQTVLTTPQQFAQMFPATGGALYGRATHGWRASFQRPSARTRVPGLYLAGGSVHPGPGVPMAALSGRLAAACIWEDLTSQRRSPRVAIPGGTWMR